MREQIVYKRFFRNRKKQIKLKKALFNGLINVQEFEKKIKKYLNDHIFVEYRNLLIKLRRLADIIRPFRQHRKAKIDKIFHTYNYTDSVGSRTRSRCSRFYYSGYHFAHGVYHGDYGIAFLYYPENYRRHIILW